MTDLSKIYKKFSIEDLKQKWPDLIKLSNNSADAMSALSFDFISSVDKPEANSIIFISELSAIEGLKIKLLELSPSQNPKLLPKAAVLPSNADESLIKYFNDHSIITLISPNPKLAMALISQNYLKNPRSDSHFCFSESDIHPTALVHASAKIGNSVKIGPYSVIGKDCVIGDFVNIAPHVVIESNVELGHHTQIYPQVTISWGTVMGEHCLVQSNSCIGSDGFGYATDQRGQHFSIPHIGRVRFGNHVHIGAGTQIDRGTYGETYIGDFTKIDNLVHIAHNCKIGKSCLITAGFMVAGSTEIGNFFVCGGRTTVTGHVKITDNVQVAGISCVQKSILKSGKYGGYPITTLSEHLKTTASSAKIVEFRKDLNRVMKHLNLEK